MTQELIDIINKVRQNITDDTDMVWTHYDSAKQLRNELETCVQKFKNGDTSSFEELRMLFSPTSALQEHAISNGWSDEYLNLAERFDRLYLTIRNRS